MNHPYILYGAPCSLYTGKARAYLLCQGIDFREIAPASEHFVNTVVPAVHRWRIPVLEMPQGGWIQDSTMIIAHFENQPETASALPETPGQRIAALLMDLIGAEGLLRPAMHYRWNFNAENEAFLLQNFRTLVPGGSDEMTREAMGSMR
ncbi:MAG: glutathione S-transferase N-terminal domain-containing protein [Thermodesulfobacteriota bacterium]